MDRAEVPMQTDEVIDTIWTKLGQEKYLVWEVKIALILAVLVSYFTMPFVITFLLAIVWVLMAVILKKPEQSESTEKTLSQNN